MQTKWLENMVIVEWNYETTGRIVRVKVRRQWNGIFRPVHVLWCKPTFRNNKSPPFSRPKNKQNNKPAWSRLYLLPAYSLTWRLRRNVLRKRRLTSNRLHDAVSRKRALFIKIAMRISNPTFDFWMPKMEHRVHSPTFLKYSDAYL